MTITDGTGSAGLTVADVTVTEPASAIGTSTASLTVTLNPPSSQTVTVQYATANGTATGGPSCASGVDYLAAGGTLTFTAGDTSKPIAVTLCGDGIGEPSETFTVALSNPTGGSILGSQPTATVTITDGTGQPILSVADATATEPATVSGTSSASLTVTLAPPSSQTVTVQYTTANGTATAGTACGSAGADYLATSGALSFNPGETSKPITVTICADAIDELDEAFTVALTSPSGGAALGTHATATVALRETDTTPCQTFLSANVPAGSTALPVISQAGCNVGDHVSINPVGSTQEREVITGFGSIIIDQPTSYAHAVGELVVRIASTDDLGRATASPRDDSDKPRKLTEGQRQQYQRTDRSGRDDVTAEGDVTAVACDAASPIITIANRDGLVEVRLLHEAAQSCGSAQVGDYLEADGEKQTEQLFEADSITLRRDGQRVH